ncbi:DNA mismatch repair protein MutS [Lachnospiraceae bacterium XPB1003]|nr:DNA mismatch repair protein MutS [Lachnospiraceae bacterium XPB1003]
MFTYETIDYNRVTPMMQQYLDTKKGYMDCILFYRLGDFYEMFLDDAVNASQVLDITLTGKNCGLEERVPMCGIPFHSVDGYLDKLVESGYKVAICEQTEDPKLAKGLVKREVVRIVTPGTNITPQALDESRNKFLMCIISLEGSFGIAFTDISTGEFFLTEADSSDKLKDEIIKQAPREIICNEAAMLSCSFLEKLKNENNIAVSTLGSWYFDSDDCKKALLSHFKVSSITALGIDMFSAGTISAGALMQYLYETQKIPLTHITHILPYTGSRYMLLDSATRRNLELCETMRDKSKRGSLFWVLDKTKTAMGARMLRSDIEQPLIDEEGIIRRQNGIEALMKCGMDRDELREYLTAIYDLERLLARISYHSANPRDMLALKGSLLMLPPIKTVLRGFECAELLEIDEAIDSLEDISGDIEKAIIEDPPVTIREGGIIKDGYDKDIDDLRYASTNGKNLLAGLENEERERTGIKNLKIKYNKVFGYYLEVTNSYKDLVPKDYVRKQTISGSERYSMPKLKELEDMILNAQEKLSTLEYDAFCALRDRVEENLARIQKTARAIARLDVLCSLAVVAEQNHFVRPKINHKGVIDIKNGRHPVVEKMMGNDQFIDNDTFLDKRKNCISVITGPNMAGKSTYMRQVALISLMFQIGSFVPAKSADLCIVDRIFTRVGASDDLASGQSTFMLEMNEVANILKNATSDSLLILDEIGRGTSTFDGLAIAWAVIEYISSKKILGAKTLFATHYHELTELEGKMDNVNNYCIAVKEQGDDIVFLRKIVPGGADKSYGIQVAKLAGVPVAVTDRAAEIVAQLMNNDITGKLSEIAIADPAAKRTAVVFDDVDKGQMSFFDTAKDEDILKELEELDITKLTPLDALNTLYKYQSKLKNRY